MHRVRSAKLEIFLTAVLFSTGGIAIKLTDLSALSVSSLRGGIATVALWLVLRPGLRDFTRRSVAVGLAQGATMVAFVAATKLTTAAAAIFIQDTAPVYVALLGPLLLGEKLEKRDVLCLVAFLAGLAALFLGVREPLETAPDPLTGNLFSIVASVCWAFTIVGFRWLARFGQGDGSTAAAAVSGNAMACLFTSPWLSIEGAGIGDGIVVAWLGLFQVAAAYAVFTRAVPFVPALTAALLLLTEPVLSAVWAWLFLGEALGPLALIGSATILAASVAQARSASPGSPATSS